MSPNRVGILLWKELLHGSKGAVFIFAIVTPIIISFIVSLLFGTLISQKPRLGIVDGGTSRIVTLIAESASITSKEYDSAPKLKKAVAAGAVDVGVVFPKGFDRFVISGEKAEVTAYVWGESLIKNRAMVGAVMAKQIRAMAGQKPPTVSLVDEKQKQTLKALVITPVSLGDIYLAKGAVGAILSLFMGVLILLLNHALGTQPVLLLLVLSLGAILAATVGVLLGTLVKDVNSLFAIIKFMGLFLYAPALIYLFPQVPGWIGRVFPTYYVMAPIIEINRRNGAWPDISLDIFILIGVILWLWSVIVLKTKMAGRRRVSAIS